jgi:hypothetical protein
MMQHHKIEVEAFDSNLHGGKILCQGPFPNNRLPPVIDAVKHLREPFKKVILLTQSQYIIGKSLTLNYDAIFQITESMDWSLALTYILHSPKPSLVIADNIQIPDAFWGKLTKGITTIHITSTPIKNMIHYDAVFFAPIQDIQSPYSEWVFNQIQMLFRTSYTQKEYREILQELRVAGAGLAWTKMHENAVSGAIYWYDAVSNQGTDTLSKRQISDILQWLSNQITNE